MTDFPEDLFSQLYRRAPSEKDRERLIAVKASLGLSPRDEMWPIIMTLDHYAAANQAARHATVKEVRAILDEIKAIPDAAGPIAEKEAQRIISGMIDVAADKIAKVAVKKTESRADTISKRQLITATIAGALTACAVAALGAAATYLILDARGICAEPPGLSSSGDVVCFVERSS
jgi:hypothetical protein